MRTGTKILARGSNDCGKAVKKVDDPKLFWSLWVRYPPVVARNSLTHIVPLCRRASMGTNQPRITSQTLKILGVLMWSKDELSGADVARSTSLSSGTLYPILSRLEDAKWIKSRWEDGDPHRLGRPRRRLYQVTALGAQNARREFTELKFAIGRPAWEAS